MLKDSLNLMPCDPWKPFKKVVNRSAVLEIVKKGAHWHASFLEYPGAADLPGMSFHFWTTVPMLVHAVRLATFSVDLNSFLERFTLYAALLRRRVHLVNLPGTIPPIAGSKVLGGQTC